MNRWPAAAVLILAVVSACGTTAKKVPSDLAPLDPTNQAPFPAGDPPPEKLDTVDGHDTTANYDWADGQGYVDASIVQVWAALQNDSVVANRRELKSWSVGKTDVDPAANVSFILDCVTADASLPFEIEWREAVLKGTPTAPTEVIARGDLAESATIFGESVMSVLSDSIVLTPIDSDITAYSAIRHREDSNSTPAACTQYVEDVYSNVVAFVHGQPLPTL